MNRPFFESRALLEDLADQFDWYELVKNAPAEVVTGFYDAYLQLTDTLRAWPESGRTIAGPIDGLQERNLPQPYEHYVLLFVGNDKEVKGYRLFGTAQLRQSVIQRYQNDPRSLKNLL
ncbi:MAG: hypothetical protein V3V20_06155 [Algisphaera sp.]